jgi:hypothetical protein
MTTPSRDTARLQPADPPPPESLVTMPGSPDSNARDIKAVSPEKLPSDASAGPAALRRAIFYLGLAILAASIVVGFLIGWGIAGVMAVLGLLGVLFNPVSLAAVERAEDRKKVIQQHDAAGTPR